MEKRNRSKYIVTINVICWLSLLISIVFLLGFLHERDLFHWTGYVLDTEVAGHFGDFVGGLIGTIVSVILLYFTFKLQREDSEDNALVYRIEILNNNFFHMVDLYKKILDDQTIDLTDDPIRYKGKEALHYSYEQIRDGFEYKEKYLQNRKLAVSSFLNFYSLSRDFSPAYFRTLYRIFQVLNEETKDKDIAPYAVRLMKVMRAQLTDTELVLLRYNAMTKLGSDFADLINKFRLIKHLPPLELMEYSYWRKQMTLEEQGCTNVLLLSTKYNMVKVLETNSNVESYSNNILTYHLNVSTNDNKSELQLCMFINNNRTLKDTDMIRGICRLSSEDKMSLLRLFVMDCIVFSTFNRLNEYKNLVFTETVDSPNGKWYVKVNTKDGSRLRLRSVVNV